MSLRPVTAREVKKVLVSTVYDPAPVLFKKPLDVKSPSINAPAAATLVASVTSAEASIPESLVLSAELITVPLPKSVNPLILETVTALSAR